MTKTTLTLSDEQLYEVYNAAWREYVCLHQQITTNPNGVSLAVLGRACESKMALGQVCDLIEEARPEWARGDARYVEARSEANARSEDKSDDGVFPAGGGINTVLIEGKRVHILDLDPVQLCSAWARRQREINELYETHRRANKGWRKAILRLMGVNLPERLTLIHGLAIPAYSANEPVSVIGNMKIISSLSAATDPTKTKH